MWKQKAIRYAIDCLSNIEAFQIPVKENSLIFSLFIKPPQKALFAVK